jgi:threonine dehydratase
VLVSEQEMLGAIGRLLIAEHVVAEPAAAAATAAFLKSNEDKNHNVVLLVTGANIATDVLRRAVATIDESW